MKGQNENEKKKKNITKEQKFYLITGISSAVALAIIVLVAVLVSSIGTMEIPTVGNNSSNVTQTPTDNQSSPMEDIGQETPDEPVITTPEGMIMPTTSSAILNDYGFYHNKTLNKYYEHTGIDFIGEVGTEVFACEDGVVESIYRDDVLTGTEIILDHGDGVKTVYRFVNVSEELSIGMQVKKGDVIATIAEPSGNEYKDGAHLHFEIKKNDVNVDPASYLTFEEK